MIEGKQTVNIGGRKIDNGAFMSFLVFHEQRLEIALQGRLRFARCIGSADICGLTDYTIHLADKSLNYFGKLTAPEAMHTKIA